MIRATLQGECLETRSSIVGHHRRHARNLVAAALLFTLAGCMSQGNATPSETATKSPSPSATPTEVPFDSEFSRDGTFQSHEDVDDIDFVYTIWSAKATPRTYQWYPKGDKFFSFTFQGYDTQQRMRDPFRTKRRVWLERMRIESVTTTKSGSVESPYNLNERAPDITFDPQARTHPRYGMLITSPKGAFELRNQAIKDMAEDTEGITLKFTAIVHVQDKAGTGGYTRKTVSLRLPIAIFESDEATRPQPVPYTAS